MQGTFFLGPIFNNFVHFLQYFHFYASYDSDFSTDVLSGLWGMFFIPRSCCWNDFPPFCGHLKQKFSKKKSEKVTFGQVKKSSLEHFLGPVFNRFVHFMQYFHFYASYDSDFFTDVLPGLWGMFFHTQIMLLKWFPTVLRSFEAKVFEKKVIII